MQRDAQEPASEPGRAEAAPLRAVSLLASLITAKHSLLRSSVRVWSSKPPMRAHTCVCCVCIFPPYQGHSCNSAALFGQLYGGWQGWPRPE